MRHLQWAFCFRQRNFYSYDKYLFHLYAAAAIRMAALQCLQQIHIATHDGIGVGENGPIIQLIAVAALWRAMHNLLFIRPCDAEETAAAYIAALQATDTPAVSAPSRQGLTQYPQYSSREGALKAHMSLLGPWAAISMSP